MTWLFTVKLARSFRGGKKENREDNEILLTDQIHQYSGRWPKPYAESIEWYYSLHDKFRKRAFATIASLAPKAILLASEDKLVRKNFEATLRWVIAHIIERNSYHGGQAVLLHEVWKKKRKSKR